MRRKEGSSKERGRSKRGQKSKPQSGKKGMTKISHPANRSTVNVNCSDKANTHNFWMRVSTADSTAWISAGEHVHTTGCLCTWSCSATYCNENIARVKNEASPQSKASRALTRRHTCPCQSVAFTRIRLSGSAESDTKIWFSWSYTAFLRTYTNTESMNRM